MEIGYKEDFIGNGLVLPIPRLTAEIEALKTISIDSMPTHKLDYVHYSVIMNNKTKQPLITAFNLNQSKFQTTSRSTSWKRDSRIRDEDQLENHYYVDNDWDKGHMVMRHNTAWGDTEHEAQIADKESFYYTNAAFQHKNMNRDEWLGLEQNIERKFSEDSNNKLCVFTGPVHSNLDRFYSRTWHDVVRIPSGFFKVICYEKKEFDSNNESRLGIKAFMMFQDDEILKDLKGRRSIKFKEYQVTIKEIEDLTGLDFGKEIFDANPLFYFESDERRAKCNIDIFPERIPIDNLDNVVNSPTETRICTTYTDDRKVAITSALINPKGKESKKEWVTIMNTTNKSIDINGWGLIDSKGRFLALEGILKPTMSKVFKGDQLKPIRLNNEGGDLRIVSFDLKLIDNVRWNGFDIKNIKEGQAMIFGNLV